MRQDGQKRLERLDLGWVRISGGISYSVVRIAAVSRRAGASKVAGRVGTDGLVSASLGILALVDI